MSEKKNVGPTRGVAHAKLEIFVGEWQVGGENAPTAPGAPGTLVTGDDAYELLPGGFFVRGRWSHQHGDSQHVGTSVLGVDEEAKEHFAHHYDNLGYARRYALRNEGLAWTFTGPMERATWEFASDGRSYTVRWEHRPGGDDWKPLCEMKGVKR